MDRIKELEKEVELLKEAIKLQKELNELKSKQVEYVPYPVYPYYPQPFVWTLGTSETGTYTLC